tara:strand:- start:31 stop:981 length:951 start_codon:yes stop_codon:yes gene_type:complete
MEKLNLPKISIITPTFNRKKLLLRLWDSLKNQKFSNFEWIILDDGSTDNTKDEIKKLNDQRIKYYKQPNKGVNAARLEAETKIDIQSKYVIYIDSDDAFYNNNTILEMYNYILNTDKSISSVIFSSVDGNSGEQISIIPDKIERIKYIDSLIGRKFSGDAIAIQKIETLNDAFWPKNISGCEFLRHWELNKKYDFLSVNKNGKKYFRDRNDNLTSPGMTVKRSKSIINGMDLAIKLFGDDLIKYARNRYSSFLFSIIIYSSFCEEKRLTIKRIFSSFGYINFKHKSLSTILFFILIFPKTFIIRVYLLLSKLKYQN